MHSLTQHLHRPELAGSVCAHAHVSLKKRHGFLRAALRGKNEFMSPGVWRASCSWRTFLTQNTPRSLPHHAAVTAWSSWSRSGEQLLPSVKCWKAGKGGRIVCKAKSQEHHVAFYTCSQFWNYLLLCAKRIGVQKLHQQTQYNPVFSPGLPGSLFHNSSDRNFLFTDFAATNCMSWKCPLRLPLLPFQWSVQTKVLISGSRIFSYVSLNQFDIKFVLDCIVLVLLMTHSSECSAPPWQS